ncbi:MAG: hypothetical protein F6K23_23265 [Okeania sp. SIO2C9]|uniref:hypothetical protein n=1 Tax=Okeania sp. SIO2C9 TaxID=2607791 RepID=UPI0013C00A25|nr:hypothetical protein [Okeania sp. SIO2C9]NEQ75706.1 hypothetical protein [Okeania sp. SIO2C9]
MVLETIGEKGRKIVYPSHVMVYKNKGYLAREQDAPTAVCNKNNDNARPIKMHYYRKVFLSCCAFKALISCVPN